MKKNNPALYSSFLLLLSLNIFTDIKAQNIYLVDAAHIGITTASPVTTVNTVAWNNATGSLQAALNSAASGGGQVWVKAATYKPNEYPNGCTNCGSNRDKAFLLRNNVALYGGFAGTETLLSQRSVNSNPTILSGDMGTVNDNSDNCYHTIITINTNATTILDGFTVTGGNANGTGFITIMGQNSGRNTGGGILNDSLSSPTISNCTFASGSGISNIYKCLPGITNCSFSGTGIVNDSFSHSIITNCSFANNTGTAIFNNLSNPNVTNCSFANNSRGMNNDLSNPIVTNCSFTNNSGGGMVNGDFTQPAITNCTFTNANMTNGTYSTAQIFNCIFANNNSAIYNTRASPSVKNCAFTNNSIGIYDLATSSPIVTNCVFANNSSYGIYNDYQCGPNITNSTFANNGSYGIYYSSVAYSNTKINNCIIWGNGSNNTIPGIFYSSYGTTPPVVMYSIVQGGFSGTGNLNTDPLYKNAALPAGADGMFSTADDGLQLLPCSPAVNSGSNTAIPAGTATDIIGANRIQAGIVDRGAYEYQGNTLASNGGNATAIVSPVITTHFTTNCQLIASLLSTGNSPVTGNATARIWLDTVHANYNGQIYLKRHYEITAATNPTTATAKITLYATQPEFDDFNNNGSKSNLPTNATDVNGIEKLRIIKFSGQSNNNTGAPSSYTQPGIEIKPVNNNILWNNSMQRWEITFDVTGFGGFLIGNETSNILPLTLLYFSGKVSTTNGAILNWRTAHEVNTGYFELQRSGDSYRFTTITKVDAKGNAGNETSYSYTDKELQAGLYYYRLRMVDKDGKETYSPVVPLQFNGRNAISLYPVPAKETVWLNGGAASPIGSNALLMDMQGRRIQTIRITQWPQPVNISGLNAGNYLIKIAGETTVMLIKQ